MAAYIIFESKVTDPERFSNYGRAANPGIAQYGGKFIVRRADPEILEGNWPSCRFAVIAFDSVEQAKQWWSSPEYQAAKKERGGATELFNVVLVEGA